MTAREPFTERKPALRIPAWVRAPGASSPGHSQDWYWAMPELAVIFFVLAIIAFLWLVDRQDREQRRHALISDILWLEQNIRFHLQSNQEALSLLAREIAEQELPEEGFRIRSAHLVSNNPELLRVALLDGSGRIRAAVPAETGSWRAGEPLPPHALESLRLSAGAGRAVYDVEDLTGGAGEFHIIVPVVRERALAGGVAAVYSAPGIMRHLVPWWFAQKYEVSIVDGSGTIIASKSAVSAGASELSYQLPFDPPGRGLVLRAVAYRAGPSSAERTFTVLILGLTVVILWSLWLLRRHVLRRERAEEDLRASHERFVTVLEGLDAAVSVRDRGTLETLYCNGRFRELFGPAAAEGSHCVLVPWQGDPAYPPAPQSQQEAYDAEVQDPATGRWYHVRSHPVRWVDQRTVQLEIATDITERQQAEEMSRQQLEKLQFTSRLVTMGEMASTLAHELNQPLSAIASYNTGCMNTLRSEDIDRRALMEAVEKVGAQARRAGSIIKSIQGFVRKSEPRRAQCDINAVVEEGAGFVQPEAKRKGVQLSLHLAPDLPAVAADRVMIEQVVLNLAKNAVEAMQETDPRHRELVVATCATSEGGVKVSVIDSGPGVPASVRDNLFQPFFSTKPEGMGMGLNICRSVVEFHGGRLWVEPNPEGGSIFSFTLPA